MENFDLELLEWEWLAVDHQYATRREGFRTVRRRFEISVLLNKISSCFPYIVLTCTHGAEPIGATDLGSLHRIEQEFPTDLAYPCKRSTMDNFAV